MRILPVKDYMSLIPGDDASSLRNTPRRRSVKTKKYMNWTEILIFYTPTTSSSYFWWYTDVKWSQTFLEIK